MRLTLFQLGTGMLLWLLGPGPKYLAGLDEDRRRARFDKYQEADPLKRFQKDYSNLLDPPEMLRKWEPPTAGASIVVRDR